MRDNALKLPDFWSFLRIIKAKVPAMWPEVGAWCSLIRELDLSTSDSIGVQTYLLTISSGCETDMAVTQHLVTVW